MKNKIIITIIILIIIAILGIGITWFYYTKKVEENNEMTTAKQEELYKKVEEYLIGLEKPQYKLKTKESKPNTDVKDFKVFTNIAKLGIQVKQDETNIYLWALIESYYVQNGELIKNTGSSRPYKFVIKNNEIIDYETPEDGEKYKESCKKIFPNEIRKKLDESLVNSEQLKEEVKGYYSYLKE